jgi:hypothetical protein
VTPLIPPEELQAELAAIEAESVWAILRPDGRCWFIGAYSSSRCSWTRPATCEARDPKGLYEKARQGRIKQFTGIDSPYEAPAHPEVRLDTTCLSVDACVAVLLEYLAAHGRLAPLIPGIEGLAKR